MGRGAILFSRDIAGRIAEHREAPKTDVETGKAGGLIESYLECEEGKVCSLKLGQFVCRVS